VEVRENDENGEPIFRREVLTIKIKNISTGGVK